MASQNGHVEVVDKLLQHGARVDLQKEVQFTALILSELYFAHIHVLHYPQILLTEWMASTDVCISEWTCGGG